jgi:coenzyme PQQ precursor peptide PqqA
VVAISVSAEPFAAIEATLPEGRDADRRSDGKGGYLITLPHNVLDRLKAARGPGESYSDVILRLREGGFRGAPLFVLSGGINNDVAELTRHAPHQRGPQTRRRNDAMVWSTPEAREVCVGMEVTSYLSAEM